MPDGGQIAKTGARTGMVHEPSASELERLIERNHRELADDVRDLKAQVVTNTAMVISQLDRYVLRAVYEADERARAVREAAQDGQIKDLKEEVTSARRGNRAALLAAVGSFIGAVVFVAFQALVKGGAT